MSARFLALETSSPRLSLALGDGEKVIAEWAHDQHWRHAESVLQGIDALLKKRRWALDSLTGIAVSVGPGSFTGIRIGLSTARAFGQFLRIPVVGVSALETLAYAAARPVVCPAIDALRGHVFSGVYARDGKKGWTRRVSDALWPRDTWARAQGKWRRAFGPLTVVESGEASGIYPEARALLALAMPRFARARRESYRRILPLYLRDAAPVERLRQ